MTTLFLRLLKEKDKAGALEAEVAALRAGEASGKRFEVEPAAFAKVPTAPFAYWVSERIRDLFVTLPPFEGDGRTVKVGLQTSDDFRFVRAWWEVPAARILDGRNGPDWREDVAALQAWCRKRTHTKRWAPFAKGGEYSPFYADLPLVLDWVLDGDEIKAWAGTLYNKSHWSRVIKNVDHYFRPGLTWPIKNRFDFKPRQLPGAAVFAHVGSCAFWDDVATTARGQGLMSGEGYTALIRVSAGWNYEVGVIQRTPFPGMLDPRLGTLALEAAVLKRATASWHELDHNLILPALLCFAGDTLSDRIGPANATLNERHARLAAIQRGIDELCFSAYGFSEEDRRTAVEIAGAPRANSEGDQSDEEQDTGEPEDEQGARGTEQSVALDPHLAAADLISWCVGVAVGRFDVRLATGERQIPDLGDPFDPLPVCSPGMLQGEDGLPLRQAPAGYPLAIDEDGILLDLPGHSDDIVAKLREVLHVVFGEHADAIEQEACAMLGARDLRSYFGRTGAGGFWMEHVKRYSKSRRVAPIYWLLTSPQGIVKVWLYAHRLDRDTLPKLLGRRYLGGLTDRWSQEGQELLAGRRMDDLTGPEIRQLGAIAERRVDLDALVAGLRAVLERTDDRGAVAGYAPDLDDGVVLVAAPLHALIPWPDAVKRNGRRISKLEEYWLDLEAGKYDWAKVAMHYWPQRVEAVCRRDKSIAIAHGRLDLYEGGGA